MKYWFPNMPNRLEPNHPYFDELDNDINWVAEVKKNGWRCNIYKDEKEVQLWNRHKGQLVYPELKEIEVYWNKVLPPNTILDGELIHFRTKNDKRRYYVFDVIQVAGRMVVNLPLSERRKILEGLLKDVPDFIEPSIWVQVGKKSLFQKSITNDLNEGIVLKKLDSKYFISDRKNMDNPFWIKVKKVEDHIKRVNYGC